MDGGGLTPSPWTVPAAEPSGWRHQGSSCTSWSVPSQTLETHSHRSPRHLRSAWLTHTKPQWCFGTVSGDKGKVSVCGKSSFISFSSQQEQVKVWSVPPLESATAAGWGRAGLCSRPLYNVLPLCSPDGSSLLLGHTMQAGDVVKYWIINSYWIESHTQVIIFTSHMCPTIGASAQECSTLIPIFPLGYEISVNDLSNHLRKERTEMFQMFCSHLLFPFLPVIALSVQQRFGVTVKRAAPCMVVTLRLIIESQEEGSRFDSI